jgi:alkanesulfonate monooxygenase SsuD/methylene tetrahydromethanopterin reductase-like flavin-dependent oxidoreductase (luciferase family)
VFANVKHQICHEIVNCGQTRWLRGFNAGRLAAKGSKQQSAESVAAIRRSEPARAVIARDHFSVFGTPDHVAGAHARLSDAGFDGVAMIFVNYLQELPYVVQEVIPQLERRGLRRPMATVRLAS